MQHYNECMAVLEGDDRFCTCGNIEYRRRMQPKSKRADVYAAIDSERDYQDAMAEKAHGDPSNDGKKQLETFVLYMDDYMTELKHQLSRVWGPDAYKGPLDTLRKVVAIGVSAMEIHGAQKRVAPTKHDKGSDLT